MALALAGKLVLDSGTTTRSATATSPSWTTQFAHQLRVPGAAHPRHARREGVQQCSGNAARHTLTCNPSNIELRGLSWDYAERSSLVTPATVGCRHIERRSATSRTGCGCMSGAAADFGFQYLAHRCWPGFCAAARCQPEGSRQPQDCWMPSRPALCWPCGGLALVIQYLICLD